MRASILILASALAAAPAHAQQPAADEPIEVPAELTDPTTAKRLADMMHVLSKALLSLPVGEIKAAAEGREPTAHDKGLTIRDLGRQEDPNFERKMERQIAAAKPMIEASMKAFAEALPAMLKGVSEAGEAMERATANMPQPGYPKR